MMQSARFFKPQVQRRPWLARAIDRIKTGHDVWEIYDQIDLEKEFIEALEENEIPKETINEYIELVKKHPNPKVMWLAYSLLLKSDIIGVRGELARDSSKWISLCIATTEPSAAAFLLLLMKIAQDQEKDEDSTSESKTFFYTFAEFEAFFTEENFNILFANEEQSMLFLEQLRIQWLEKSLCTYLRKLADIMSTGTLKKKSTLFKELINKPPQPEEAKPASAVLSTSP